jgi:hypothetical protein
MRRNRRRESRKANSSPARRAFAAEARLDLDASEDTNLRTVMIKGLGLGLALACVGALIVALGGLFAPGGDTIGVMLIGATLATAGVAWLDFQQHRKKS